MHLSYDELALVFSFLDPVELIPTLNLVCKQWYEVSSIKNGVNTFLWKQWYCSAIDYYIARTPKPYRRKWLTKKKNKTDHRNYRELLNGIIVSSEYIRNTKIKTKIGSMFHAPYVQILSFNLDQILVLLRANEKLFAKLGPTAVGQGFFQKLLGATKNTRDSFSKLCTLLDVMNISTDTKFVEKNWKDISSRISEHSYSLLLPTQQMILYGLFEEAKILHEKYGFPLSFCINDTVTITSTNVLLCRDTLRFQNSSARPSYYNNFTTPPEAHVQMLEWLIEKEGMPTQCLDLMQPTQVIVYQPLNTTPIACVLKQFYSDMCFPVMEELLSHGADVNSGIKTLCEYCERNVQFVSDQWLYIISERMYVQRVQACTRFEALLELFKEENAFVELQERFAKIDAKLNPGDVMKQVPKGGSKLDYCTIC